jgi:tripartite-type tricarboxylate transporter receptor subunit TctC
MLKLSFDRYLVAILFFFGDFYMNIRLNLRHNLITATLATVGVLAAFGAQAQANWPTKSVTLVVPFNAGGPTDVVARSIAASMTKTLGQTVLVENKNGAGGTVGAGFVKNAQPDGYTFLIHHNGMATAPALYRKLAYNPLTDFEYVSQVADVPMTLIGHKDLPPKNTAELIAYVKANAKDINLANAGLGAVSHLCGMMFQQAINTDLTTIPFTGTAPAMTALRGKQVQLMCDQTTQTIPQIKAGEVKLYGVTTAKRIKALPDAPTLAEGGIKGFEMVVWHGIYAPKNTPKAITEKFNGALRAALKDPEVVSRFTALGVEMVPESKLTPEGLQTWLKAEIDRYGPAIRAAAQFAD